MPEETEKIKDTSVCRFNAQKHAILRESVSEYEKANTEELYNDLAEGIKPQDRLQELIVETIASNTIRLMRIAKAESEFIKQTLHPSIPNLRLGGYDAKISPNAVEKLELYSRYQTATENRIHRSISLLRELQNYGKADKT